MSYSFQIGDKAVYIPTNETVKVVNIDLSHNHIEVEFDDGAETVLELQSLKPIDKFDIDDDVIVTANDFVFHNMKAKVVSKGSRNGNFKFYEVTTDGKDRHRFDESELKLNNRKNEVDIMVEKSGYFEEKGHKLGKLVDEKQAAYGDSISKASKLMKVYLEDYKTHEGYLIPEELLDHILLQVRIIDKQNRIFSNPKADKMDESPYSDLAGYGLLGEKVQNG